MEQLTFNTNTEYINFIKDLIGQIEQIEKIDSYKFILKVGDIWYYVTFKLVAGTEFSKGRSLTLLIGSDAQKLKSTYYMTYMQKYRAMQKFGYSFYSEQFAEEEEINALFLQIESKYIDLSNFNKEDLEQVFSSASEFLSRFSIRRLSETSFAIFYNSVHYHLTIKETYTEYKLNRKLVWIKKNDSNIIEENFVTYNDDLINQIFDFLTFCEYLHNTNNDKFLDIMRKVANINGM